MIDAHPGTDVVALSDIKFSGDGVDEDGVYRCQSYTELGNRGLDVLFVSLPNDLAADATLFGLKKGLHVFCEKPPGRSVEDIRKVIQVDKTNPSLKLKYGFNHRYHESVKRAKALIESGKYGRVMNLRGVYGKSRIDEGGGEWRSKRATAGGGILLDQGIHMLDMMLYFAGNFEEVHSFVSNEYWGHDVEDNAFAILRSRSGCVAMIHSTATQWRHKFRLEITLEGALIELAGILSGSKSYGQEQLTVVRRDGDAVHGAFSEETTQYLEDNSWRDEVHEFVDLIVDDREVHSGTSEEALRVMELVYRIYHADQQWRDRWAIPALTQENAE